MLQQHRCSMLFDKDCVQSGDFKLCCNCFATNAISVFDVMLSVGASCSSSTLRWQRPRDGWVKVISVVKVCTSHNIVASARIIQEELVVRFFDLLRELGVVRCWL
ncbi:hypothetical protein V6N12_046206 [Hibiscus sabdariffa]|uniref:Uncharacterized protein n=1 Tax=Hibiscus sabdariffa TaxID=183260 RepID=A0ABR2AY37_9ROSI